MKKFYIYFVLGTVLLIVLYEIWALPFEFLAQKVVMPTAYVVTQVFQTIISPVGFIRDLKSLDEKNKSLEQENLALKADVAKVTGQNQIMQASKTESEASKSFEFESVQARVIGQTPYSYDQTYIINKGTNDGLKTGDGVMSSGNLIGRIKKIYSDRSEVESIMSHDSIVPVRLLISKESGLLQGGLEGLVMTDIPMGAKIQSGDQVMTSGLGGDLPPGILVGKVEQIIGSDGELFQKTRVSPITTFADIQVVSVAK